MNQFETKINFGEAGEQIFFDYINSLKSNNGVQNYILMRVDSDSEGWHYLDGILINKKTNEWSGLDVKMKPSRYLKADTGINKKSLDSYKRIKEVRNLNSFQLVCIDPVVKCIYSIELDDFIKNVSYIKKAFKQVDDGRVSFDGDIHFTELKFFSLVKKFNDQEAAQIMEFALKMNKIPALEEYTKRKSEIEARIKLFK